MKYTIKLKNGSIYRGHRHHTCFTAIPFPKKTDLKGMEQGFITSENRYVDRKEGAEIQIKAGIKSVWTGKEVEDILFSEDLY